LDRLLIPPLFWAYYRCISGLRFSAVGFWLGGDTKASGGLTDLDKAADLIKEWRAK
jgi:hypothetical protein